MLEDEPEELAAGADAPVLALVADALRVEERPVQLERGEPQRGGEWGRGSEGGRGSLRWRLPCLAPHREVEVDDGVPTVPLGVDRVQARAEQLELGRQHLEEAHRAIVVAQALELEGARERALALLLRRGGLAQVGLRGDRIAHLAEGVRDGLLPQLGRFARSRVGERHATADLAAGEEGLQQPGGEIPCARGTAEEIAELLALAAIVA